MVLWHREYDRAHSFLFILSTYKIKDHYIQFQESQANEHMTLKVMVPISPRCEGSSKSQILNSLAPRRFQFNIRKVIFKITVNGGWGISYEIALRWMPQGLTGDKSTLVQVMAWCRQASSHYLSQCWPRSMSPNGVTRPQCVNSLWLSDNARNCFNFGQDSFIVEFKFKYQCSK